MKMEHVKVRLLDSIAEELKLQFGLILTDRQSAHLAACPDPRSTVHTSRHFIRDRTITKMQPGSIAETHFAHHPPRPRLF